MTQDVTRRYRFPDKIVAQARMLLMDGYSQVRVAHELASMFPGEDTPTQQALSLWQRELVESGMEELANAEVRIALRFDRLVDAKMDALELDLSKVRLPELIMGAGVYRDKTFRRQDLQLKHRSNEAAHSLADAISRLASLDTSHLADLIEGEYEVNDA